MRSNDVMSQGEGYSDESLGESDEKVVFNVGGRKFETFKDTLRQDGRCFLCDDEFLENHYRKDKGVYFFDRDPDIFRVSFELVNVVSPVYVHSVMVFETKKVKLPFKDRFQWCFFLQYFLVYFLNIAD